MSREILTLSQLRHGDSVLLNGREIPVGGVARFDAGSRVDLHVLDAQGDVGTGPSYAFGATSDERFNVVRRDRPMVAYTEYRFVHVGMHLLCDPHDVTGLDYDPDDGSDMAVYVVREWRAVPAHYLGSKIEIKADPLHRDTPGGTIVLCESPTFPLRLAEWPEVAVLTAERDAALERLDMIERDGVERPGVGAVA